MKQRLYQSQFLFLRKHRASRAYIYTFKLIVVLAATVRVLLWTTRLVRPANRKLVAGYIGSYALLIAKLARY